MTVSAGESLIRYTAPGQRHHTHLLPRTWPEDKRRPASRPSHCGAWSSRWRPAEFVAAAEHLPLCPACSAAVGIKPVKPKRLVPAAVPGHRVLDDLAGAIVPTAVARLVDPQLAHAFVGPDHRITRRRPFLADIRVADITDH